MLTVSKLMDKWIFICRAFNVFEIFCPAALRLPWVVTAPLTISNTQFGFRCHPDILFFEEEKIGRRKKA